MIFFVPKIIQTQNKEYYTKNNDKYIVMYSFLLQQEKVLRLRKD